MIALLAYLIASTLFGLLGGLFIHAGNLADAVLTDVISYTHVESI